MRRLLSVAGVLVLVGGAAALAWVAGRSTAEESTPPPTVATATAEVIRTDLVQTETLSGRLRFTDQRTILAGLPGTVTWLPDEAERLERGSMLAEVDGAGIYVLIGERPAWRPFDEDMDDGDDVRQLQENLIALGYLDEEVDGEYGDSTADAVEAWREDLGLPEGRALALGRVVFLPRPVRTGAGLVDLGAPVAAGAPLMEVSSFDQEVVIDLDPEDLDLISPGDRVTVVLPGDREVDGRISEVSRVVRPSGPEPDAPDVVEVTVVLGSTGIDLEEAPVDVEVESDRAAGVLAVPVRALIALSDGGYALEVQRDGGTVLIGVETGDFAGGLVEVTGDIDEGDVVVVPA